MSEIVKSKVCPGCLTRVDIVSKNGELVWKKHSWETKSGKYTCPNSGTPRGIK